MLVAVKNLVKRYKDVLAVDNVSLDIEEGEILDCWVDVFLTLTGRSLRD
ncbi:MAG: hypothetical protein WA125_12750 [Desulfosporosinus sp.]